MGFSVGYALLKAFIKTDLFGLIFTSTLQSQDILSVVEAYVNSGL